LDALTPIVIIIIKTNNMTSNELYDYIIQHMTAEQALKKLLESSLLNYQKLKFNEGEEIHPIILITMAAMDLNWQLAVKNKDDEDIQGISVGTEEYLKELFNEKANS
jgi:hypothetical protein